YKSWQPYWLGTAYFTHQKDSQGLLTRGGLTTHGAPSNRGSWGPCVLAQTQKKPMKKVPGHLMGPPTDPGPSGSAPVSKWSVRPC
ncbi:unnamed protein product, partial [Staurois parvus]